jgi:polyphosphate kinase 2
MSAHITEAEQDRARTNLAAKFVVGATKPAKIKRSVFDRHLKKLEEELVQLQLWVSREKRRIVVLFEGRDSAGKGGIIKCITSRVSPRVFRVVALPAPTEREKSQLYIQRYIAHLPAGGEIVLFDRSWYNRAGVERVMGFCSEAECQRFLEICPPFERVLTEAGVQLIKYWFEISQEEQTRRLESRIDDGRKIWKLSPMDIESHRRWYDYSRARDEMLRATDTPYCPWYIVDADDKRSARINCISHLLSLIPYKPTKRETVKLLKPHGRNGYEEPLDQSYHVIPNVLSKADTKVSRRH